MSKLFCIEFIHFSHKFFLNNAILKPNEIHTTEKGKRASYRKCETNFLSLLHQTLILLATGGLIG